MNPRKYVYKPPTNLQKLISQKSTKKLSADTKTT